jgi:non-heme chloroperoxidase
MHQFLYIILFLLPAFSCQTRKSVQMSSRTTASSSSQNTQQPARVMVGDVELHYIEMGQGEPLILLHGGQGDYRTWPKLMDAFSSQYRVISYSRRYHYPNANPLRSKNYSALIDAADLAGFITALKLGPVHLVGTSYGAFTALAFALEHPELVRTMALAEPPVLQWAASTERGARLYREFITSIHEPAGKAFATGDDEGAMRIFIDRFDGPGTFDSLPAERRRIVMENSRFFKAITASSEPFPNLSREKVGQLKMPVLLIRGAHTKELDILVSEELASEIKQAEKAIIPQAGHGSARQNPSAFNEAVLQFLGRHIKAP